MASSLVNNKYRITRRIGGGSFGEIYMGIGPNNEKVAVKFERQGTRCPQLRHEFKVYRELTGCHGFCQVYHFGVQDNYNVMVMDLLGPSLEDLFNKCNRRFSLKTVLQIADQMLERVDTLHSRHLIHRDIKPANFVIGVGETASTIFCVDFGLSKRYRHPKNLQHIPHRDGRSLTGTPRYASINNHLGIEQSRRDDLESIGYVLIYFLKGSLPWQGLKAKNAQKKYRYILEKKQLVSIAQLCQGCPSQFAEFLAYTRSLKFDAKPDIPYLRKLFRDLYHAQNCAAIPKVWDWEGMDNDYSSAAGSNAPGATPVLPLSNQPTGLRPTTAAAVVSNNGVVDSDLLLGVNGEKDDLDEDFDQRPMDRPNTAGAMLTSGYNRSSSAAAAAGGSNWGSGAANGMKPGNDYAGVDGQARRPHTAHGARAGFPTSSAAGYSAAPSDPSKLSNGMYGEQEDGHVVAGAREMMRYRRNKASGMDGSWGGADPAPAQMNAGVASWAVYPNGKPTGAQPQMVAQQQAGKAPTSGMGGWPFSDRPKSANIVGPGMNQSGGGLMPQGARPSSSNPTGSSLWQQQSAGVGSGKAPAGAPSTNTAGAASGTSSKSKLFSLAR